MRLICKICLVMALVLGSCTVVWADELPPYVKADWGASADDVMFWEREPVYCEKSSLKPWQLQTVIYERHMLDQQFLLLYSFESDKLCAVDYYLDEENAARLSVAEMKAMLADIDANILPQLGTFRTAVVEKGLVTDGAPAGLWRYGKMASNERICMLVVAVADESGKMARFSVSFADVGNADAAAELKGAFDDLRRDEVWSAETAFITGTAMEQRKE